MDYKISEELRRSWTTSTGNLLTRSTASTRTTSTRILQSHRSWLMVSLPISSLPGTTISPAWLKEAQKTGTDLGLGQQNKQEKKPLKEVKQEKKKAAQVKR